MKILTFLHKPGNGNPTVKASTLFRRFDTLSIDMKSGDGTNFIKSWGLEPEDNFFVSRVI